MPRTLIRAGRGSGAVIEVAPLLTLHVAEAQWQSGGVNPLDTRLVRVMSERENVYLRNIIVRGGVGSIPA